MTASNTNECFTDCIGKTGRQAVRIFELRREWWFPLIITLWERVGDGDDPFKGHFELWHKRGDFVRRHTAERYQEALEAMA